MAWNYAELSKAAKNAGGPEKLVDTLVEFGKRTGHKEMLPIVGAALGLGALGYAGLQKLVRYLKDEEKKSAEAAQRARKELIQGIKDYDAAHPTNDESENDGSKAEKLRSAWDFTAQKAQAVFASDEKTILRPVQTKDADFYVTVKAQYSMMYRVLIHMRKVDNESLLMADLFKPESFYCIIEDAVTDAPVGYIGIKDTQTGIWEIAIELDQQFTRKGYGMRSIRLFLNEMHRITGITEYKALVETDNLPSQKCFEKLGSKLIGLCNGPILKAEEEKERFEESNLNLIDENMNELADRLEVEPRKLLSHVLEYRMTCPL